MLGNCGCAVIDVVSSVRLQLHAICSRDQWHSDL